MIDTLFASGTFEYNSTMDPQRTALVTLKPITLNLKPQTTLNLKHPAALKTSTYKINPTLLMVKSNSNAELRLATRIILAVSLRIMIAKNLRGNS